ncbi:MAG: hypothetical protein AB1611_12110 [bacterium]
MSKFRSQESGVRSQNLIGWIVLAGILLIFGASPAYTAIAAPDAAPSWSPDMADTISRLSRVLAEQQSEKTRLFKEIDRLAEKILQEKQKSEGRGNRKLDSLMQDSQRLVSSLETVSRQTADTESQLRQKYSLAITALVKRLEEQPGERERKALLKHLLIYLKESEGLEKPVAFETLKVNLEVQDNDTSSQIRKKADFLSDQAALLKARIFQIEAQVTRLESEKALRDKVRKFADGMSFFDDTLMVKERKIAHREPASKTNSGQGGEPEGGKEEPPPMILATPPLRGVPPLESQPMSPPASPETGAPSFIVGREGVDSSPSDLILSRNSIDRQIELLKEQKSRLASQIQQLQQKTHNFYKRAKELDPEKQP